MPGRFLSMDHIHNGEEIKKSEGSLRDELCKR